MNILLDTHALIWFINGDRQLPDKAISIIKDLKTNCYVSIASIWEIAIKQSLGKLELNGGLDDISDIMVKYEIELLPITFDHIQKLLTLEYFHRDPFDRIIISQGITENFTIISRDEIFQKYTTKVLWDK
jgi:PIN domain nuclease of toxin-antitoxin system